METILNFLKEKNSTESENIREISVSTQELKKINSLFENKNIKENKSKQLRLIPRIQKNQIWSVKCEYDDFMGLKQKTIHPFIIIIKSEPQEIEDEDFIRVNVISPFIEFASSGDLICNDFSIIGFPFLIEAWNDQPMLSEILDEYLGYFDLVDNNVNENSKLNKYQLEFRDIEVTRAKFLNNSVNSLLTFLENRQTLDIGVLISLFDEPQFPKLYHTQKQKEPEFTLAAKSGIDSEDKYIHYKTPELPFEIFVRKNENGFIITILPFAQIKMFNSENVEIAGNSNNERYVIANLKKGLYTLTSNETQMLIKIRLK